MRVKNAEISTFTAVYKYIFTAAGLFNLLLVIFDALYLTELPYSRNTLRDVLLYSDSSLVRLYDSVKGIEAHRFTEKYLLNYGELQNLLANGDVKREDVYKRNLLAAELIADAKWMIDEAPAVGPFSVSEKQGTLELIKKRMRSFTGNESARISFEIFFDIKSLKGPEAERRFKFFNENISPLLRENYFRPVGEDGKLEDFFYRIDVYFVIFFLFDFIVRWFFASFILRKEVWYLFFIHRWFEVFFLFPPEHSVVFRLFRILPLYIRLNEYGLFKGKGGLLPDIIHDNASVIAKEISSMVLSNILFRAGSTLENIETGDFNGILKGESGIRLRRVFHKITNIMTEEVLPSLSPGLSHVIRHSVRKSLDPWLVTPAGPLVRFLILNIEITADDILKESLESAEGKRMMREILYDFLEILLNEISKAENFTEIRAELSAFLTEAGRQIAENPEND